MPQLESLFQETAKDWSDIWMRLYRNSWFRKKLDQSAIRVLRNLALPLGWKHDVTQEAWLILARQLQRNRTLGYDSHRGQLNSFLSTVVYRCCLKSVRKLNGPRHKSIDKISNEPFFESTPQVQESLDLRDCIERLDEPERSIVEQIVNGKTVPEIAREMNRSPRTIYRRMEEAKRLIREQQETNN